MKKLYILISLLLALSILFTGCEIYNPSINDDPNIKVDPSNCSCEFDKDDDGLCDSCGESVIAIFDLYVINDLHGKILDSKDQPGIEELSTYLEYVKSQNSNTILLSSGDMWQGTAESNLTYGAFITEWMNELGFVSMTLGNHEFDWGVEKIEKNESLADFPFLAINIYDKKDGELADFCDPSVVIEMDGLEIGIIGSIGDVYSSISGEVVGDMYFKTGTELTELVKAEATRLRNDGVDFIIYSTHADMSEYDKSLSRGYVDIVFEGHSHQEYAKGDGSVYHIQNGGENEAISHASAKLNRANGNSAVIKAETIDSSVYSKYDEHPIIDTLLEKYEYQISKAYEPICKLNKTFYSKDILTICAELYYNAGVEMWGDEYDIVLGGGFMSARSPYQLSSGNVDYAMIYSILPFDNQLVLCSVKGSDLVRFANKTPEQRYYTFKGEYGESVLENIDENATYYIITDTYSSTYASNKLTEVARYTPNVYARDLFAEYLKLTYGG